MRRGKKGHGVNDLSQQSKGSDAQNYLSKFQHNARNQEKSISICAWQIRPSRSISSIYLRKYKDLRAESAEFQSFWDAYHSDVITTIG